MLKTFLLLISAFILTSASTYDTPGAASQKALKKLDCEFEECPKPKLNPAPKPKVIVKEKVIVKKVPVVVEKKVIVYKDKKPTNTIQNDKEVNEAINTFSDDNQKRKNLDILTGDDAVNEAIKTFTQDNSSNYDNSDDSTHYDYADNDNSSNNSYNDSDDSDTYTYEDSAGNYYDYDNSDSANYIYNKAYFDIYTRSYAPLHKRIRYDAQNSFDIYKYINTINDIRRKDIKVYIYGKIAIPKRIKTNKVYIKVGREYFKKSKNRWKKAIFYNNSNNRQNSYYHLARVKRDDNGKRYVNYKILLKLEKPWKLDTSELNYAPNTFFFKIAPNKYNFKNKFKNARVYIDEE